MNNRTPIDSIEQLLDRVELHILLHGHYVSNVHTEDSLGYIMQARNLLPIGSTPQVLRSALGLARQAVAMLNGTTDSPEKG